LKISWAISLLTALNRRKSSETVFERVRKVLATCRVGRNSEADFLKMGLESSLSDYFHFKGPAEEVELLQALENKFSTRDFSIRISAKDAGSFFTVGDIVNYLNRQGVTDDQWLEPVVGNRNWKVRSQ